MGDQEQSSLVEKRVWDLPTRLFHWLLVLTVSIGWWLGDNLSFSNIDWHFYLGYATIGLLVFRLFWGFYGPEPSRLRKLFVLPSKAIQYLPTMVKRTPSGTAGHNPLGGYSVIAMLLVLFIQAMTGLFAEADDLFSAGPLSTFASDDIVRFCNYIHDLASTTLLVLVILHVSVILFYRFWKGENLIKAMITGQKTVKDEK